MRGIESISRSVWSRFERVVFHPGLFEDSDELLRARLMLVTCMVYCAMLIPLVLFAHAQKPEQAVVNMVVLGGHLCVMATAFTLRLFPTSTMPVAIITLVATAQLIHAAFWSGGPNSVVLLCYPIAPVFFSLVGRAVHGISNALGLILGLGVMYVLHQQGFDFKTTGPTVEVYLLILGWAILTGLGMATYASNLSQAMQKRLVDELEQRTQAEQDALAAREAKDWFIAYLSHEMRSPLSVISGGVDLLHYADGAGAQRRHLNALKSATAGMVRLMDDVLDISALERGQVSLKAVPMDLASLVRTLMDEFTDSAKNKGLYISLEGVASEVRVSGDPQRVRQVLSNLVGNAIKYTSSGGISMAIEDRGEWVQVAVADTGPGIAEENQDTVFEPYARADVKGTRGTGLGLAISSTLVERMGSKLFLESVVDEGSTFSFLLPKA